MYTIQKTALALWQYKSGPRRLVTLIGDRSHCAPTANPVKGYYLLRKIPVVNFAQLVTLRKN
jgi:hypothetical protein